MSEDLNKDIRDFFIKIGEDIKKAFDECCPCNCLNHKNKIIAKKISDVENQITQDIHKLNNTSSTDVIIDVDDENNDCDLDIEEFKIEENVIVKRKQTFYYDCSDFREKIDENIDINIDENYGNQSNDEFETKCDPSIIEDDFVIIF